MTERLVTFEWDLSKLPLWASSLVSRLSGAKLLAVIGEDAVGLAQKHLDHAELQELGPGSRGEPLHSRHGGSGLFGSISKQVAGEAVLIRSNKKYARAHAEGMTIKPKSSNKRGRLFIMQGEVKRKIVATAKQVTLPKRNIFWLTGQEQEEMAARILNLLIFGQYSLGGTA